MIHSIETLGGAVEIVDGDPPCRVITNGIFIPTRHLTKDERECQNLLANQEWHGGIFHEDGFFEHSSGLYRAGRYAIMAGVGREKDPSLFRDETVLYGGILFAGHYGHFLIETLARLWRAAALDFDKVVFHVPPGQYEMSDYASFYFRCLGVDVEIVREPTKFRKIIIPDAAITVGGFRAYTACRSVYRRIFSSLSASRIKQPVYLSRSRLPRENGKVEGEEQLETLLKNAGWNIVHPETMPAVRQIEICSGARQIAGVIGSAMHNTLFSKPGTVVSYLVRDMGHVTTLRTFGALDHIMGLKARYLSVGDPIDKAARIFKIEPQKAFAELSAQKEISLPEKILGLIY